MFLSVATISTLCILLLIVHATPADASTTNEQGFLSIDNDNEPARRNLRKSKRKGWPNWFENFPDDWIDNFIPDRNRVPTGEPTPPPPPLTCDDQSRLMLAIRCQDGTERLRCAPPTGSGSGGTSCRNPNPQWANEQCIDHEGFDKVLPYYSGCYPKSLNFWEQYASDDVVGIINPGSDEDDILCNEAVVDLSVPPLTPPNVNFEDSTLGIAEWNKTSHLEGDMAVRRECDDARCIAIGRCAAYEGLCYAYVGAGGAQYNLTEPEMLSRNDFRIPEVDASGICKNNNNGRPVKYCFSFAMRFDAKDFASLGRNDRFQVKIQVNDDDDDNNTSNGGGSGGPILYERLITIADVGDNGDTGWMVEQVPLPHAGLGDATFFTFEATSTNVGSDSLDSVGYIDDIQIVRCR